MIHPDKLASTIIDLAKSGMGERTVEAINAVCADYKDTCLSSVDVRLANIIFDVMDPDSGRFNTSQHDMADIIGASRSHVCCLINGWKRRGILNNYGRTWFVLDASALQAIASKRNVTRTLRGREYKTAPSTS